jgi:3-oxoacyl-[acyl-carrier-protein] synthase II
MDRRETVITGLGLVTPLGKSVPENILNLEQQKSGIGFFPEMSRFKPFQYAGKVSSVDAPKGLSQKMVNQMKFLNRGAFLGFLAAYEALASSGLDMSRILPGRRALVVGAGDYTKTGYDFLFPAVKKGTGGNFGPVNHARLNESALYDVNPFYILESLHNNLFSFLSALYELRGPNASFASLSPCGLHALETASRMIRMGHADMALVVGCGNWVTEIPLYELHGLGLLSHCEKGARSFKPLDKQRDGFIPGEGGAAVLLESRKSAEKRGALIHGCISAMVNCMAFDGFQDMAGGMKSSLRSMEMTLENAGMGITDLGFISPHGNGTRKGDRSDLESVKAILGKHSPDIPVVALKPYSGHMGAASDVAEVILGMGALQKGMVPATLNFNASEERFSRLNISSTPLPCAGTRFLSVSRGIGGQVASILVEV